MKFKNLITLVIAFYFCSLLHGQTTVYEGNIDKYPIVLEVTCHKDNCTANYFYTSKLMDIYLDGKLSKNILHLDNGNSAGGFQPEIFDLKKDGDKLNGTWSNETKKLNVSLHKISSDSIAYHKKCISLMKFKRDSVQTIGKKQIVWLTESISNTSFFRLGNGFSKETLEYVNPKLDSLHYNLIDNFEFGECHYVEITNINVQFVNDNVLSFTYDYYFDCGGAHPAEGIVSKNIKLKNFKEIKLENYYNEFSRYDLLKEVYKDNYQPEVEDCDLFDGTGNWEYSDWFITPTGISFIPSLPHVAAVCMEVMEIPYSDLEKYKKKNVKSIFP